MHPSLTTRNVAIAGAVGSSLWLLTLLTFSANELKDVPYNPEKGRYEQIVQVKTHGWFSRLLPTVFLVGMMGVVVATNPEEEELEEIEEETIAPLKPKRSPVFKTEPLPTPELLEEEDNTPFIPVTEIVPRYAPEPIVEELPTTPAQEDLTKQVLKSLYGFRKKHLACVGETGAGKTSLLLGLQKMAFEETNGSVDMYVCTVKKGSFLGLEDQIDDRHNNRRIFVDQVTGKGIIQVLKVLNCCLNKMNARGEAREAATKNGDPRPVFPPVIVVLDEMNTLVEVAKSMGRKDEFLKAVNAIANTGREDDVRVWLFGQDYQVQNLGINSGYRDNFGIAILGRIYHDEETNQEVFACEKMESAFVGKYPLISNGRDYWDDALSLAKANKGIPVIWTSLSRQSCLMPYMPDIEYEKLWLPPVEESPTIEVIASITP